MYGLYDKTDSFEQSTYGGLRMPVLQARDYKNINQDFTDFCFREIEILKRLVSLLEKEISTKKETYLAEAWTIFEATLIDIETNNIE